MGTLVPEVEVADDVDGARTGRPDGERGALRPVDRPDVRPERVPEPLVAALGDEVEIELAERRKERVRVAHDDRRAVVVAGLEAIARERAPARQDALEHSRLVHARELDGLALLRQHAQRRRSGPERAHDDAALARMRPEDAVGIGVLARDDALDLVCGRHAPRPLRSGPASSVRRRERERIGIVNLPRSSGVLLHVTSLPGGGWVHMRSRSSIGSPPRARPGGRCSRSHRPTARARPTRRPRHSRAGRGCSPIRRQP